MALRDVFFFKLFFKDDYEKIKKDKCQNKMFLASFNQRAFIKRIKINEMFLKQREQ